MRTSDERALRWADHLQRDGGRDRRRGCVHEGPGLCRLAGARSQADLDRGPHHPGQDIQALRGNRYLRVLFGAGGMGRADQAEESWERHGLKSRIEAARKRLHHNVLAIALAPKLARIAWSVLAHGRAFEATK